MLKLTATLFALLTTMLFSPGFASPTLPGEKVPQDSQGWVEDDTVVVITPNGENADVFSEGVKVAIKEERVSKQLAKKDPTKQTTVATATE